MEETGAKKMLGYVDVELRSRGFTGFCGLEFVEAGDEEVVIGCDLRPELLNPVGIAHGGIIATLLDVAAGSVAIQLDRQEHHIVTQTCNIHYLRPGLGKRLTARARPIRKGRRVCVVEAGCRDESDRLIAESIYEIAYLDIN